MSPARSKSIKGLITLSSLIGMLLITNNSQAQISSPQMDNNAAKDSSRIQILHISKLRERSTSAGIFRDLEGEVHLRQKNMDLWCDKGFIKPNKQVEASGKVHLQQEDSIHVYSDTLYYDGFTRIAQLHQNVRLVDTNMVLYTDLLNYDLNTKRAVFPNFTQIRSDSTLMTSKRGFYEVKRHRAHFEDSVRIENPNFSLKTDSLDYDTQTEIAYFLGPTTVNNPDKRVYCEDGYYDTKRNYAALYQNAQFENYEAGKQETARGDTILYDGEKDNYFLIGNAFYQNETQEVYADTIYIDNKQQAFSFMGNPKFVSRDSTEGQSINAVYSYYDDKSKTMVFRERVRIRQESQLIACDSLDYNTETKEGWAQGAVVWDDTAAKVQIRCEEAFYNDSTKFLLAHRQPVLRTIIDADTLWLRADTLWSYPDSSSTENRNIKAYHQVLIYKSDLQVRCDSLHYNGSDSTFRFFQKPILWVDGTQFIADTIDIQLRENQIYQLRLFENSFIVNTNDSVYFNQIKGRNVISFFEEGQLDRMTVFETGETVYYAVDDNNQYIGVNDVDCQDMHLFFEDKSVRSIRFEVTPSAVFYPMHQVNHLSLQLPGFQWLDSLSIRSKDELINFRTTTKVIDSLTISKDSTIKLPIKDTSSLNDNNPLPLRDTPASTSKPRTNKALKED